ncbi:MAG TPA: SH3 domain-containing protein [Phnomibacter sp.]|nr:SH3 domain-containing protein [Phnomibacter sp.]
MKSLLAKGSVFMVVTLLCVVMTVAAAAQAVTMFAAAKSGLSLRDAPSTQGKVLTRVPLGTKLNLLEYDYQSELINTEGFKSYWAKVKVGTQTGYVVSAYLLPMMPPKAGTATLEDYLKQIGTPHAPALVQRRGKQTEEGFKESTQVLYKSGAHLYVATGYEWYEAHAYLPGVTVQQAWQLMRLLASGSEPLISDKADFPHQDITETKEYGKKWVMVYRDAGAAEDSEVIRIRITSETGAYEVLEIYRMYDGVGIIQSSAL